MSLLNLFTEKIVVGRISTVSGDKTAYATVTAEYGNIQRVDDEKSTMLGGAIGKTFRLYTNENADIQKGDMLKDEDGNEYKVAGITIPASIGNFIHKEAIIILVK